MSSPAALSRRADFEAIRASGIRRRSGPLGLGYAPSADGQVLVGYAIGRHVGGAVVRNRLRRRLRPMVREASLGPGRYLFRVAPEASSLDHAQLGGHLRRVLSMVSEVAA